MKTTNFHWLVCGLLEDDFYHNGLSNVRNGVQLYFLAWLHTNNIAECIQGSSLGFISIISK